MSLTLFLLLLKILHIGAGSTALILGTIAYVLRRKTKKHRPVGRLYFWSMMVVVATTFPMAWFSQNWFLFMVGIFTFHMSLTGYRSVFLKEIHLGKKPGWGDWLVEVVTGVSSLMLLGLGIYLLMQQNITLGTIASVFGGIGLFLVSLNVGRFLGQIVYRQYALMAHVTGMLGSYAGAWTAFLANNAWKWGVPDIITWLAPTVVITVMIATERWKLKALGRLNLQKPKPA